MFANWIFLFAKRRSRSNYALQRPRAVRSTRTLGITDNERSGGNPLNARRLAAIVLLVLPSFAYGQGQEDPYSRLAFFEGTWTVEGQETTYRETCSWFEDRRFHADRKRLYVSAGRSDQWHGLGKDRRVHLCSAAVTPNKMFQPGKEVCNVPR